MKLLIATLTFLLLMLTSCTQTSKKCPKPSIQCPIGQALIELDFHDLALTVHAQSCAWTIFCQSIVVQEIEAQ